MGRLTAAGVAKLRSPGRFVDGDGLALRVVASDQRYWSFRYERGGRERSMSLGNANVVTLAEARKLHTEARAMLSRGTDPLDAKRQSKRERAKVVTFSDAAEAYIVAHRSAWRGRGEQLWRASLKQHVFPVCGGKPVDKVKVDDVRSVLEPIWVSKTVTATIVRSRIELILDYAKVRGWRSGENPALWRGNLRSLLPPPAKIHRVEHLAALAWREAPALMGALAQDGLTGEAATASGASRCLAFLILTAVRSGEARGCRWDEIDMEQRVWIIPAARMKGGRKEHRVPLSEPAMNILRSLAKLRTTEPLVFLGHVRGRPMRDTTLTTVLRRLSRASVTVHGMRSCFRDWAADTGKPAEVAEMVLAHTVGSAVARAYARSDLLDRRRELMAAWADYLTQPPAVVVPLRRA
jgi:integrase